MPTIKTTTLDIDFSTHFNHQLIAAPREVKLAFREALELFREDPEHPLLRNHSLKAQFAGYRSIDVTGDYRAIFREAQLNAKQVIIFSFFGTHKQLYS